MNCNDSTRIWWLGSSFFLPRFYHPIFISRTETLGLLLPPTQNLKSHNSNICTHAHHCTFWSLVTDLRDKKLKLTAYISQTQQQKKIIVYYFFFSLKVINPSGKHMAVPPLEILQADGSSQLLSCHWVKASCFVHCQCWDDSGYWQCQHRLLT